MLKAIMCLVLLCSGNLIYANDDEEMQDFIPFPKPLLLMVKDQVISDDVVRGEIYSHAIKCMTENNVLQITKERLQSVYVSLKDLECQIFETEIGAIRAARSHIDELAREHYLAFTPRRNAGYF